MDVLQSGRGEVTALVHRNDQSQGKGGLQRGRRPLERSQKGWCRESQGGGQQERAGGDVESRRGQCTVNPPVGLWKPSPPLLALRIPRR